MCTFVVFRINIYVDRHRPSVFYFIRFVYGSMWYSRLAVGTDLLKEFAAVYGINGMID